MPKLEKKNSKCHSSLWNLKLYVYLVLDKQLKRNHQLHLEQNHGQSTCLWLKMYEL